MKNNKTIFIKACVNNPDAVCENMGVDMSFNDYFEREFGWLEESGISLDSYTIENDSSSCSKSWANYISYIFNWAFEHASRSDTTSPLSFEQWVKM